MDGSGDAAFEVSAQDGEGAIFSTGTESVVFDVSALSDMEFRPNGGPGALSFSCPHLRPAEVCRSPGPARSRSQRQPATVILQYMGLGLPPAAVDESYTLQPGVTSRVEAEQRLLRNDVGDSDTAPAAELFSGPLHGSRPKPWTSRITACISRVSYRFDMSPFAHLCLGATEFLHKIRLPRLSMVFSFLLVSGFSIPTRLTCLPGTLELTGVALHSGQLSEDRFFITLRLLCLPEAPTMSCLSTLNAGGSGENS